MTSLEFTIKELNKSIDLVERNLDTNIERTKQLTEQLIITRQELIKLADLIEFKQTIGE